MELIGHGEVKFPDAGLLATSRERRWSGVAAELRAHPRGEIPAICSDQMEVTLAVGGSADAVVERRGNGRFQATPARTGTLWFCPIGVQEDSIRITAPIPQVMHLYLPNAMFASACELNSRAVAPDQIFYMAGVDDELVRQIGYRILRELKQESAAGSLLVEQLSSALIVHLLASYSSQGMVIQGGEQPLGALDPRRLERVKDYVEGHLEEEITIAQLAAVACLSRHHFARAFRQATGMPPHRYVSSRRLDHAKHLLSCSNTSLAEIALACGFSSQASFTRAFQKRLAVTPGEFRRGRR